MVSTGFDGKPILILSLEDAEEVHTLLMSMMVVNGPLYKRVTDFLRGAREDVGRDTDIDDGN